jgi:hypothetical protein
MWEGKTRWPPTILVISELQHQLVADFAVLFDGEAWLRNALPESITREYFRRFPLSYLSCPTGSKQSG